MLHVFEEQGQIVHDHANAGVTVRFGRDVAGEQGLEVRLVVAGHVLVDKRHGVQPRLQAFGGRVQRCDVVLVQADDDGGVKAKVKLTCS